MITRAPALVAAAALMPALAACDRPEPSTEPASTAAAEVEPRPSPTPTAQIVAPGTPSASREPGEVLKAWASAVEARDWKTVRAYWGDAGAGSGLDERAFAARWSDLLAPRVRIAPGREEGAAGSLYFTAPVTITDGARQIAGEIVLRRANDVPGASDEQLRWHIESTTLDW